MTTLFDKATVAPYLHVWSSTTDRWSGKPWGYTVWYADYGDYGASDVCPLRAAAKALAGAVRKAVRA